MLANVIYRGYDFDCKSKQNPSVFSFIFSFCQNKIWYNSKLSPQALFVKKHHTALLVQVKWFVPLQCDHNVLSVRNNFRFVKSSKQTVETIGELETFYRQKWTCGILKFELFYWLCTNQQKRLALSVQFFKYHSTFET